MSDLLSGPHFMTLRPKSPPILKKEDTDQKGACRISEYASALILGFGVLFLLAVLGGCVAHTLTESVKMATLTGGITFLVGTGAGVAVYFIFIRKKEEPNGIKSEENPSNKSLSHKLSVDSLPEEDSLEKAAMDEPSISTLSGDFSSIRILAVEPQLLSSVTLSDPSSLKPLSKLDVLQRILLQPDLEPKKQDLFIDLLVKELIDQASGKDADAVCQLVRSTLKYFDQKTIKKVAEVTCESTTGPLWQLMNDLVLDFKKSGKITTDLVLKKTPLLTNELRKILANTYPEAINCLGTALDAGFCFYHAMAQLISFQSEKPYTMADLGKILLDHLNDMEEDGQSLKTKIEDDSEAKGNGYPTYEEYKAHLERLKNGETESSTSWGSHFISGRLLADLFFVNLEVTSIDFKPKKVKISLRDEDDSSDVEESDEYVDDLENFMHQTISIPEDGTYEETITLALIQRHYIPIFQVAK